MNIAEYLFPSSTFVKKVAQWIFKSNITKNVNVYDSNLIQVIDHEVWWINVSFVIIIDKIPCISFKMF